MKAGNRQWQQGTVDWQDAEVLTQLLREHAEDLINRGLEIEFELYRARFAGLKDEQGRDAVVRNGFLPTRWFATAIGPVAVRLPKVRSRLGGQPSFRSMLVPRYSRGTEASERSLTALFIDQLAAGNAARALCLLLGQSIVRMPVRVGRELDACWSARHVTLRQRHFARGAVGRLWVHSVDAAEPPAHTLTVAAGDQQGGYQLFALERVERDSHDCWLGLLGDLRRRGFDQPLRLAVHLGATAFWAALRSIYPNAVLSPPLDARANSPAMAQMQMEITA